MRRSRDSTVIKLGGSQAFSSHLPKWVEAIARHGGELVIVPGGGLFADAVRDAQPRMALDDRAAHHMALLAMEQYGLALASLNAKFSVAASVTAIQRHLSTGGVPVWSPTRMVLGDAEIPQSWDVTSDSLAAWLAGKLGSRRLILVKHLPDSEPGRDPAELSSAGIVDPLFPRFYQDSNVDGFILQPGDHVKLGALLGGEASAGICITLHPAQADEVKSGAWRRSKRRAGAGR